MSRPQIQRYPNGVTMTVGELIDALSCLPRETPVLGYSPEQGNYLNVAQVVMCDEDIAVNIGVEDTYDTRQW